MLISDAIALHGRVLVDSAKLWTETGRKELEQLALDPWAKRRRAELLSLLDHLSKSVEELNQAVEEAGHDREESERTFAETVSTCYLNTPGFRRLQDEKDAAIGKDLGTLRTTHVGGRNGGVSIRLCSHR